MTSENTDAQTTVNDTETALTTPAAKRPRRATRAASTPSVDSAPSEATAATTEAPAPKKAPAKKAAAKPAVEDAAPAKKATRTRKPAAAETVAEAAAPESAAPVKKATRTRKKPVTDASAVAPVVTEPVESSESAVAPKKATRSRKKATPVEEAPAPAEAVESATVAPAESAPAAPKRRRATRQAAAPVEVVPEVAVEAAVPTETVPAVAEPTAEESPAPARRSRSRRATRPAAAAAVPEVAPVVEPAEAEEEAEVTDEADAPVLDVLAAFSGVTPEPEKPTATGGRLATTALLFQAPEATPRRRRRAQAPTGSPEEIAAAAHAEAVTGEDVPTTESAESAEPTEDAPTGGNRRSRGRRGGRKRSPQSAETAEDETTESVEDTAETAADDQVEQAENEDVAEDEQSEGGSPRRRRRRGGRGRRSRGNNSSDSDAEDSEEASDDTDSAADAAESETGDSADSEGADESEGSSSRRRRRRRRSSSSRGEGESTSSSSGGRSSNSRDEVTALRGSTRLEAKRQRRREGRDAGRRRQIITEAEFLARRESVERSMIVREVDGRTQIAVLEDGVLVEHYVSKQAQASMVGNVYLGRVQNVLPSMEAAFVDVGRGRNAVLYAGEVNWDAAGVEGGKTRRIEQALKSGDSVLVQVTKDPIGHKGARLTSQVTLAGRYLVYVPGGGMTGISRKLPDNERSRLKKILREVVPDSAGVIVRTAAEGASEEELRADIARLQAQWEAIEKKSKTASAPALLQGEPDMAIRVVRDIFNDDFSSLVIQGDEAWSTISGYIGELAPDLAEKVSKYVGTGDVFHDHRVDEQLAKGMDRKVWLPSGGSLVIDRTEAMTVVDVNTGKFTGAGGTLEETVTRNNLEAAEEIVRQLRLRDIGGIIVIDFIDMVLESNRDLVLRRLVECLGRDRTKHQVAEVTSLGLVQMTRKRVGQGLVEAFSETCEHCHGRGFIVHTEPVEKSGGGNGGHQHQQQESKPAAGEGESKRSRRKRGGSSNAAPAPEKEQVPVLPEAREQVNATLATIAAAAAHAHQAEDAPVEVAAVEVAAVAETVESTERPVLDVLAAFGGRDSETVEASTLALAPVDPSVFEDGEPMPEAEIEEISATEQAADQGAQSPES